MFVKKFDYSYWNYVSFTDLFTFSKIVPGPKFQIISVGEEKSCFLDHVMVSLKIECIIKVHDLRIKNFKHEYLDQKFSKKMNSLYK